VKRALAWLAGLVGIAALGRWLARRNHPSATVAEPVPVPEANAVVADAGGDPAEELRQKLAHARAAEEPGAEAPAESLDERRARVHAKAREAIDSMADDGETA
jgi:hypothetical protein